MKKSRHLSNSPVHPPVAEGEERKLTEEERRRVVQFFDALRRCKLKDESNEVEVIPTEYPRTVTKPKLIATYLRDIKGCAICDDCLASQLELANRQQANVHTAAFAETSDFAKAEGICSVCQDTKLVTSAN